MADKSNVPYDTISRVSVSTHTLFNKCCCCVPLRLGCFILGYLNLTINVFQTLALLAVTAFIGLTTHGFDHFDKDTTPTGSPSTDAFDAQGVDQSVLARVGLILIILVIANVSWMVINIACLVGLHKKRPGPIRVYVGFATARLMLAMLAFIYLMMTNRAKAHTIATHSIDLGLTAYFILVYYIYAVKLEKEREVEVAQQAPSSNVYIYPTKLDKSHLVA